MEQTTNPPTTQPATDKPVDTVAAAKAKAVAAITGTPAPKPTPVVAEPAKIDMDAATLKQLTKAEKANREYRAKIAAFESDAKELADLKEAKKLYAEGKTLDAFGKWSGKNPLDELERLQLAYLDAPIGEEKDELASKVEEIAAKLDADEVAKKTAADEATKQAEIEAGQAVQNFAFSVLDSATDGSFELCSRPDNRVEAATAALELVKDMAFNRKLDNVTQEQAATLYKEAFALIEAEYEELGKKRYLKEQRDRPRSMNTDPRSSNRTLSPGPREQPQNRPSPNISRAPISTKPPEKALTPAQAKQRALDAIRGYQN